MRMSASGTSVVAVSTSTTRAPGTSASSSSRTRVTPERSTRSFVAPHSGHTSGRSSALSHRKRCWHDRAYEQPEAAPPVQHAHREPVGVVQRGRRAPPTRAPNRAAPRAGRPPGRAASPRPRRRAAAPRPCPAAGGDQRLDGRRGRAHDERHIRRGAARSRKHVARVPGRRALFLQRLVGIVDDDRGREVGHRRERGDPAADHDAVTRAARAPALGACRVRFERVQQRDTVAPDPVRYDGEGARPARVGDAHDRRTRSAHTTPRPGPADRAAAAGE